MAVRSLPVALGMVTALVMALAGCTPQPPAPTSAKPESCTRETLPTRTPGKLTIATGQPAHPPWFRDDKPDNGEGFEAATAYAVAGQLGYAREDVLWTRVSFEAAIAPGQKEFDFAINQFSITEERKRAVDFSAPYYLVRQAVIALRSAEIAGRNQLTELREARLGAQAGTTSHQAITDVIRPTTQPRVYDTSAEASKALRNGQLDGLVVDLPTALHLTRAEIDGTVIVGQLPQVGAPDAFGLVLDRGSPATSCVSRAVAALRDAGSLADLERQWLAEVAGVPELT